MTTSDFLASLAPYGDQPLGFATDRVRVAPGYHVTEVKSVVVRAMDCGGQATEWGETVLQVLPVSQTDPERMSVRKFQGIFQRTAEALEIDDEAQVRVEYGEPGESAVSYLVSSVASVDGEVEVRLAAPAVACKGANRSVGNIPLVRTSGQGPVVAEAKSSSCCTPVSQASSGQACCS